MTYDLEYWKGILASRCRLITDIDTACIPSDDWSVLDEYAKTRFPAYGDISFERICAEVLGETQANQLRRLIGFTFTRHPSINWPEERLDAVERHLQRRARQLLG